MKKYVLILLMLGVILPSWAGKQTPISGGENAVTTTVVNLRTSPSKSSKSLGKVQANEQVTIVGTEGDWSKVQVAQSSGEVIDGYVISSSLKLTEKAMVKTIFEEKIDNYNPKEKNHLALYIVGGVCLILLIVVLFEIFTRACTFWWLTNIINSFQYGDVFEAGTSMGLILLFSLTLLIGRYFWTFDEPKVCVDTVVAETCEMELPGLKGTLQAKTQGKIPTLTVRAGDSIRVMGVQKRWSSQSDYSYWVELKKTGSRGLIPINQISLSDEQRMLIRKKAYLVKDSYYLMSVKRFEYEIMGRTLTVGDPSNMRVTNRITDGTTTYCSYALHVLDPESGDVFCPIVHYNRDMLAVAYDRAIQESHLNTWLRKVLPFAGWIYDCDWLNWIVEDGRYWLFCLDSETNGFWSGLLNIVVGLTLIIIILAWLVSLALIPFFVLTLLARLHYLYYLFSNAVLCWVIFIVGFVFAYGIILICLSEFCWIYYLPLTGIACWYAFIHIYMHIDENRCDKCKMMYSKRFLKEDLTREYDTSWHHRSKKGELLNRETREWDTWDDVTYRVKDGYGHTISESTQRENEVHHTRTTDTHMYYDYRYRYHVEDYQVFEKCRCCDDISKHFRQDREVVDEELEGTHTRTITY